MKSPFRSIRQKLFNEGKLVRYLGYAVGEIALIIIGIMVALQLNNWNEDQKAQVKEEEYLARLEVAFERNAELAEKAIEGGMHDRLLLNQFIQMTPEETGQISPDKVWSYLRALWRPNLFTELNSTALSTIIDAGQLSQESSPELLIAISNWRARIAFLADQVNTFQSLRQETMQALSYQPELQRVFSMIDREDDQSDNFLPSSLARRVREDNEVISLAAIKGQYSRVLDSNLRRVQDTSNRIVQLIQQTREN